MTSPPKAPDLAPSVPFTPLGDRVLVLPTPAKEVGPNEIILPDSAKERPTTGTIVAISPALAFLQPPSPLATCPLDDDGFLDPDHMCTMASIPPIRDAMATGSRVCFSDFGGLEIEIEGTVYYLMRLNEILGVLHT
jgi:co-chaperonin GroES (HSP10)